MSAGTIALRLVIGGDSKGAQAALKGLGTAGGRAGKALKVAQTGAAIGLTAIVGIAGKGVQSYETLVKSAAALQRQSKISAEDASLLTGQWQRYGVAAEAGGKGVMMLSKQIDAANTGTKTSIDSFARLGITLDDLKTMSPYQVLEQVRSTLSQMPPSAERTALSAKLLGKGFMSMSKWIAASSTDLDALNQQLKDTGQVMDEAELTKAKDDMKQMALLQVDLRGLFVEVGRSAMPIIRDLVPGLKKLLAVVKPLAPHLVEIGGALAAFLVVSKVATGLGTMVTVLRKLKGLLAGGGLARGLAGVAGAGGGGKPVAAPLTPNPRTFYVDAAGNTSTTKPNPSLRSRGNRDVGAAGGVAVGIATTVGIVLVADAYDKWRQSADEAATSSDDANAALDRAAKKLGPEFTAKMRDSIERDAYKSGGAGGWAMSLVKGSVDAWGDPLLTRIWKLFQGHGEKAANAFAASFAATMSAHGPATMSAHGSLLPGLDPAILKAREKLAILRQELEKKQKLGAPDTAEWAAKVRREEKRLADLRANAARPAHTGRLNTAGWTGPLNDAAAALASFRDLAASGINPASLSQHKAWTKANTPPAPVWHAPGRALGGYVRRTPGGTLLRVGEGKYDEVVAQVLPGKGESSAASGGDTHFHFHVGQLVGTDERAARNLWNTVKPIAMSDMRMKMAMSRG